MPPNQNGQQQVNLIDGSGGSIGNVILPNDILNGQGTVDIQQAELDDRVDTSNVVSQVVSVNLFDADGNPISGLSDTVELCLTVPDPNNVKVNLFLFLLKYIVTFSNVKSKTLFVLII